MFNRSIDSYGGPKANYSVVTDPTTDEDAAHRNRYVCDVGMMMLTAPRGFVRFVTANGATPSDPVSNVHAALWGSAVGVKPVVARTGEGVWTVTLPATVGDDLTLEGEELGGGVTHTVSVRAAIAQASPVAGVLKHAVADVTSANVITVYGYLANGTADDIPGSTVTVLYW